MPTHTRFLVHTSSHLHAPCGLTPLSDQPLVVSSITFSKPCPWPVLGRDVPTWPRGPCSLHRLGAHSTKAHIPVLQNPGINSVLSKLPRRSILLRIFEKDFATSDQILFLTLTPPSVHVPCQDFHVVMMLTTQVFP